MAVADLKELQEGILDQDIQDNLEAYQDHLDLAYEKNPCQDGVLAF